MSCIGLSICGELYTFSTSSSESLYAQPLTYLLSPCYALWHIGQEQVSSTLLCCWLFFLLCPRCILFPLFHFRWCASTLFLVFLSFFSLLVSILGIPLSCLQMIYVEHDPATKIIKKNFIVLKRLEIQDGCPGL